MVSSFLFNKLIKENIHDQSHFPSLTKVLIHNRPLNCKTHIQKFTSDHGGGGGGHTPDTVYTLHINTYAQVIIHSMGYNK